MVLDISAIKNPVREHDLIADIMYELNSNNYKALLLDTGGTNFSCHHNYAQALEHQCINSGKTLYISSALYPSCRCSTVIIPSAISGGTLLGLMCEAKKRYGKVALEIDISLVDFTLPSRNGQGTELNLKELINIKNKYHCQSFFSEDLCAHYFTYRSKGQTHFVLYDNQYSIQRKLCLAEKADIDTAFVFYPHVKNIITDLEQFLRHE